MRCPKCGYLGFEQVDRCRNCGYEFSLAERAPTPELALHDREAVPVNPLDDLSFLREPETELVGSSSPDDLPLFGESIPDDEPLITKASPPRPPLAVRRATADVPRLRAEPMLDLVFDSEPVTPTPPRAHRSVPAADPSRHARPVSEGETAGLGARFVAAVIDLVILAVVDVLVVYFTMEICGVTFLDFRILPKAPLLAFVLLQNGGYLAAFTAGGQTLGKMAMGIRVVTADEAESLDLGRAILRTLLWVVLAVPGGLGFLTALLSRDHRGLHDRIAGTRVVRASV